VRIEIQLNQNPKCHVNALSVGLKCQQIELPAAVAARLSSTAAMPARKNTGRRRIK
jgi:hypothetical protein